MRIFDPRASPFSLSRQMPGSKRSFNHVSQAFDEMQFMQQVEDALVVVRKILDTSRHPSVPEDSPHTFDDKFALAEFLGNLGLAAQLNSIEQLGLDSSALRRMRRWAAGPDAKSVTLRLETVETCEFNRTETRQVDSPHQHVTETTAEDGQHEVKRQKLVTTVTEHSFDFGIQWRLVCFPGTDPTGEERLVLSQREGRCTIKVAGDKTPRLPKPARHCETREVDATWLCQMVAEDLTLGFSIDRTKVSCRTPRRNDEVDTALNFFQRFGGWCVEVKDYISAAFSAGGGGLSHSLASMQAAKQLFVPVVALLENQEHQGVEAGEAAAPSSLAALPTNDGPSRLLPVGDVNKFLEAQKRSISEQSTALASAFPAADAATLVSVQEVRLAMLAWHCTSISAHVINAVQYLEEMLTQQLVRLHMIRNACTRNR